MPIVPVIVCLCSSLANMYPFRPAGHCSYSCILPGSIGSRSATTGTPSSLRSESASLGNRQVRSKAPSPSSQSVDAATPVAQPSVSEDPDTPCWAADTEGSPDLSVSSDSRAVTDPGPPRSPLSSRDANGAIPARTKRKKGKFSTKGANEITSLRTVVSGSTATPNLTTILERLPPRAEILDFSDHCDTLRSRIPGVRSRVLGRVPRLFVSYRTKL